MVTTLCCLYAAVTDVRSRRIKNTVSWGLLYFGVVVQTAFWMQGVVPISYVLVAVMGGGAFAYLAHLTHMAAAGDGKLFWAASVALPPVLFESSQGYLFSPLVLGINTFTSYVLLLLVTALWKTSARAKLTALGSALAPKAVASTVFGLLGFVGVGMLASAGVEAAASAVSFSVGPVMRFLVALTVYLSISAWAERRNLAPLVPILGASVFGSAMIYTGFTLPGALMASLPSFAIIYVGVYAILRPLVLFLAEPLTTRTVAVADLAEGDIPAETIVRETGVDGTWYFKGPSGTSWSEETVVAAAGRPLTDEETDQLRELDRDGDFDSFAGQLLTQRTIPFAPFIALGVVLTVLARGTFYELLR